MESKRVKGNYLLIKPNKQLQNPSKAKIRHIILTLYGHQTKMLFWDLNFNFKQN